jgi:hypothetical protein
MAAQQGGDALGQLIREEPPGLATARTRLTGLVAEAQAMFGNVSIDKVMLAGFSQGAMTAMVWPSRAPRVPFISFFHPHYLFAGPRFATGRRRCWCHDD